MELQDFSEIYHAWAHVRDLGNAQIAKKIGKPLDRFVLITRMGQVEELLRSYRTRLERAASNAEKVG